MNGRFLFNELAVSGHRPPATVTKSGLVRTSTADICDWRDKSRAKLLFDSVAKKDRGLARMGRFGPDEMEVAPFYGAEIPIAAT